MTAVKRNEKGEISHILVGTDMMAKEDAFKVLYGHIDPIQILKYLEKNIYQSFSRPIPGEIIDFIADIFNEKETIHELKKKILGFKK